MAAVSFNSNRSPQSSNSNRSPHNSNSNRSPQSPRSSTQRKKTNIYAIAGHGDNGTETFIVPQGTTVVVREHIGDPAHRYTENINSLCEIDNNILAKPLKNSVALNEAFGSVAIYPPGSECPNFRYYLFNCFRSDSKFWEECIKSRSGIIDIRKAKRIGQCTSEPEQVDSDNLQGYFAGLFENSVWPQADNVAIIVEQLETLYRHRMHRKPIYYEDTIMNKLENLFTITQEEICDLFPGVYYNFICRGFDENESESFVRDAGITEAELHRKPHLKAYYAPPHYKGHKLQKIQKKLQGYDTRLSELNEFKEAVEEESWNWNNASHAKQEYNQLLNYKQRAMNELRNVEANNTLKSMRNMAYTVPNGVYNKINGPKGKTWVRRSQTMKKSKNNV